MYFFLTTHAASTTIYTLSLHDALPIFLRRIRAPRDHASPGRRRERLSRQGPVRRPDRGPAAPPGAVRRRGEHHRRQRHRVRRSEEHTSELQSQSNLVCRLLLEKKKTIT